MASTSDIERLRLITQSQTALVLVEARLAEEAIGRTVEDQEHEDTEPECP
jgi:hypothetical protein